MKKDKGVSICCTVGGGIFLVISVTELLRTSLFGLSLTLLLIIFTGYHLSNIFDKKKFSFGITYFYFVICLINYLGYDDKSIILDAFSLPVYGWIKMNIFLIEHNLIQKSMIKYFGSPYSDRIIYIATLGFGFLLGLLIDWMISKVRSVALKLHQ